MKKISILLSAVLLLSACDDNEIKKEDVPETVTQLSLTFTPQAGGTPVVVTAFDPDAQGPQSLIVDGEITLAKNQTYNLEIEMVNDLAAPGTAAYDISGEVEAEADEHLFLFSWTNNAFSNPAGNGNIDSRADAVNYSDADGNGLPLGLSTQWTTNTNAATSLFRVILKHQPDLKTSTSGSDVGETDLDVTFVLNIN